MLKLTPMPWTELNTTFSDEAFIVIALKSKHPHYPYTKQKL